MMVHIVFSLLLAKVKVSQRRITSLAKGRFSSARCRDSSSDVEPVQSKTCSQLVLSHQFGAALMAPQP